MSAIKWLKNILSNITFSLKKGEILTIVGPSGSGKSSILKIIAGLIKPSNRSITFLKIYYLQIKY